MAVVRRTISLDDNDERRILVAVKRDHGASFSNYVVAMALRRADELGVPDVVDAGTAPAAGLGRPKGSGKGKATKRRPG